MTAQKADNDVVELPRSMAKNVGGARWCSHCGVQLHEFSRFCASCGAPVRHLEPFLQVLTQPAKACGLGRVLRSPSIHCRRVPELLELHPIVGLLALFVNWLLLGRLFWRPWWLATLAASPVLGFIAYEVQKKWYGDDAETATTKGSIVAVMIALSGLFF